ncbi:MAG: STAS/SEC14 domain-containing protein [Reyranellaceae bacterium]
MPVTWTISHPDRLIVAVAEGTVTLQEIEQYLDGVVTSDVLPYRKIFDVTQTQIHPGEEDMMMLGARIRAYPAFGRLGSLAIVASNARSRWMARLYAELANVDRPIKIFRNIAAARRWLDAPPDIGPPANP